MPVIVAREGNDMPPPRKAYQGQASFADETLSPEDFAYSVFYELSGSEFLGDAFPFMDGSFTGPGIAAAYLGADLILTREGNIWFGYGKQTDIRDLHFEFDPRNKWYVRTGEIMKAAHRLFGRHAVIGHPDLGGVLDILATFRGTQKLLLDLYDHPEEVLRLIGEIKALWRGYFRAFCEVVPREGGYCDWSGILSAVPVYMTQSDFSYMIGPAMFDAFALPELAETCGLLERGCYHLDGIGELPHLDSLLKIDALQLVQWVPGDGKRDRDGWRGVYDKILDAGKRLQIVGSSCDDSVLNMERLIRARGVGAGVMHARIKWPAEKREDALRMIGRFSK